MPQKKRSTLKRPSVQAGTAGGLAGLVPLMPANWQPYVAAAAVLWGFVGPYVAAKAGEGQ